MWERIWPLFLIVASNVAYNIATRSTPSQINPFFSLVVTYLSGAAAAAVLYFVTTRGVGLRENFHHLNWTSWGLGLAILFLEVGYIYLYRAGWKISVASLVANIILAVALLGVGLLAYHEAIQPRQWMGIAFCIVGLVFLNWK